MTIPRYLDRNTELVRKRLIEQVKISLDKGNKFIEKEMSSNLFVLVKPIIKFFYNEVKRKDMESGSYKQIDLSIKAAKDVILEQISLEMAIERYFQQYLKSDQTYQTLKKHHKNYPKLVNNTKDVFREQVRPLIDLLQNDSENITTYENLAKETFKSKEKTLNALTGQFEFMEQGLKWIKEDLTIINLPMGRDILYKILLQGYQETVNELVSETEAMYDALY
ncbi:MAG: hypothetical protein JW776_10260 [Candidatus Lokiarchaeota archaeon]|nr:hypothetical protein [Candidatus Lokiarchaeota archaeon]